MTPTIPIRTFTQRCPRHQTLVLSGKMCTACLDEKKPGPDGKCVDIDPLRGERFEDAEGKRIECA